MPSETTRTDNEVLSEFMEPRPTFEQIRHADTRWWISPMFTGQVVPVLDRCPELEKLGRLRLIEERLTEEQRKDYMATLFVGHTPLTKDGLWKLCHASAEQKIRALAEVLRQTR